MAEELKAIGPEDKSADSSTSSESVVPILQVSAFVSLEGRQYEMRWYYRETSCQPGVLYVFRDFKLLGYKFCVTHEVVLDLMRGALTAKMIEALCK
jgi:hypothetical protein